MKNYYFTFGQDHFNNDGQCMSTFWVIVESLSYDEARSKFIKQFMCVFMPKPDGFSFQYSEDDFEKIRSFFTGGLYKAIR